MYKVIHRILILIIISLSVAFCGSTAGSFADNPISVKSLALGSCSATLLDASSSYKNPAAIKVFGQQAVNTMHGRLFNEVNYLNLTYVRPELTSLKFGFGFSFLNNSLSGIEETTYDSSTGEAGYTGKKLSYSASAYVFSFSNSFNEKLFYGTNLKIIQESLAGESSSGAGADLGLLYKYNDRFLFGFSAINILKPNLRWSTGAAEQINGRFSLGGTYKYNDYLDLLADIEKVENRNPFFHAGIEYRPVTFFAFRLGYDKNRLTIGTGLNYSNINIDYAYIDNNQDEEAGITQYISAGYIFAANTDLSELENKTTNEKELQEAIAAEQLRKALEKAEAITTETAEIEPLPISETPTLSAELAPSLNLIGEVMIDQVEPIIDNSTLNETTIIIEEEYKEPVHDLSIALISARYYKNSKRLVMKVFIDNTGNQDDQVTCNARLFVGSEKVLQEFPAQTALLKNKETKVFYFIYNSPHGLLPGNYYLESETHSGVIKKYQKEKFINRKN